MPKNSNVIWKLPKDTQSQIDHTQKYQTSQDTTDLVKSWPAAPSHAQPDHSKQPPNKLHCTQGWRNRWRVDYPQPLLLARPNFFQLLASLQTISIELRYLTVKRNWKKTPQPLQFRPVVPGCAGCAIAHPDFGRSVNPISTRWDRLCPPNY